MEINKKIKCISCGQVLECNDSGCIRKCGCGKVAMSGGIITEGVLGKDYVDITPKLLNE